MSRQMRSTKLMCKVPESKLCNRQILSIILGKQARQVSALTLQAQSKLRARPMLRGRNGCKKSFSRSRLRQLDSVLEGDRHLHHRELSVEDEGSKAPCQGKGLVWHGTNDVVATACTVA